MKRRDFIINSSRVIGIITTGSGFVYLSGCTSDQEAYNDLFSSEEVGMMNELGNVIIPPTSSPGAKEAKVGEFIALIVKDCYPEYEQVRFKEEIQKLNRLSQDSFGKKFMQCSEEQRIKIATQQDQSEDEGFGKLKDMIVSGYLSSKIGATQFFDYYPVPGRYDGCITERPW